MDDWNPIMAETYVKRLPWWHVVALEAFGILLAITIVWLFVVVVFQLDLFAPIFARFIW